VNVIFTPLDCVGRGGLKGVKPLGERLDPLIMKMLPCARFAVLLAASRTAVIVGGTGPPPPPVVILPAPLKLRVKLRPIERLPVRLGNDPVAPAKLPVPPVIVADPVSAPPESADTGIFNVPVSVPVVPLVRVMVKVPLRFWELSGVSGKVPLNVPVPIPLRLAWPLAESPEAPRLPVAFVT
jgi:hypothetical protein